MAKKRAFSLRPEAGEEGILSNANVEILSAIFGTYGEHGTENMIVGQRTAEDPVLVLELQTLDDEGDSDGTDPQKQYVSCGKAARVQPSEDGEDPASEGAFLCSVGEKASHGVNKGTNFWHLLNSFAKPAEGKIKFNTEALDDKGVEALVGMKFHLLRVPAPKRAGLGIVREEGEGEQRPEQTIVTCQQILELPKGQKSAAGKAVAGKAKPKAKVEEDETETEVDAGDADPITEEAQAIVVTVLDKAGDKGVKKVNLPGKVLPLAAKSKNRKKIMELVQDDEFLANDEAPWQFEDDVLTAVSE